jgi:hypothetical protein
MMFPKVKIERQGGTVTAAKACIWFIGMENYRRLVRPGCKPNDRS